MTLAESNRILRTHRIYCLKYQGQPEKVATHGTRDLSPELVESALRVHFGILPPDSITAAAPEPVSKPVERRGASDAHFPTQMSKSHPRPSQASQEQKRGASKKAERAEARQEPTADSPIPAKLRKKREEMPFKRTVSRARARGGRPTHAKRNRVRARSRAL